MGRDSIDGSGGNPKIIKRGRSVGGKGSPSPLPEGIWFMEIRKEKGKIGLSPSFPSDGPTLRAKGQTNPPPTKKKTKKKTRQIHIKKKR